MGRGVHDIVLAAQSKAPFLDINASMGTRYWHIDAAVIVANGLITLASAVACSCDSWAPHRAPFFQRTQGGRLGAWIDPAKGTLLIALVLYQLWLEQVPSTSACQRCAGDCKWLTSSCQEPCFCGVPRWRGMTASGRTFPSADAPWPGSIAVVNGKLVVDAGPTGNSYMSVL
jgi:hypothetical protein